MLAAQRTIDRPPFGEDWVRRFIPHYIQSPLSRLHRDAINDLRDLQTHRAQKRYIVAPRGSAKTTWLSKAYPLHGALEGIEPLTLILAETGEQARTYLDAIKQELEGNPAIAEGYPSAAGKGPVWQTARIRLRNGCEIIARGSGGRILGVTTRDKRPTLVIVDDGNARGDAYSPTTRQRKLDWFTRDVLPVGEPRTNFVVAGTAIHREAIVCFLRAAGWMGRSYKAVERMPDAMQLWHEWEKLLGNLADPSREETAAAFYAANRAQMDAGAELLWPDRLPLYKLMAYRAQNGEAAFKSEYQDEPGSPEGAEWPAEYFERDGFWFEQWPERLRYRVIALDPSKGIAARNGDYQAHAMVALGEDGYLYMDADLRREPVERMCERTVELARLAWPDKRLDALLVEENNTLGFIQGAIQAAVGAAMLPWECLTNSGAKEERIRIVSPYLYQGKVRVRNTPGGRMLVGQWREFPFGEKDDAADAVGTAVKRLEQLAAVR